MQLFGITFKEDSAPVRYTKSPDKQGLRRRSLVKLGATFADIRIVVWPLHLPATQNDTGVPTPKRLIVPSSNQYELLRRKVFFHIHDSNG